MEAVTLADRARINLQHGESHYREFKSALEGPPGAKKPRKASAICRDIAEALVAFANADGGDLMVGVEDDKAVTGVPHSESDLSAMLNAPDTHVLPGQLLPVRFSGTVDMDGKQVLFFSVAKGTSRIYQLADGRCVRRADRSTVPVSLDQLQFERHEVRSREFETLFRDDASVADLDLSELQLAAHSLEAGLSVERYLQLSQLAEFQPGGLQLRAAALLLFAKDIARWHPRSEIRILRIRGTELLAGEHYNVTQDAVVAGSAVQLVRRGWERLRDLLVVRTDFLPDATFQPRLLVPEQACYEALINAIAHRDYSIYNPVEARVFDDRLEIKSPGALLSTLKIDQLTRLEGAHESRNALMARCMKELGIMRELGEGMRRIFGAMESNAFQPPRLHSNGYSFTVTLFNQ